MRLRRSVRVVLAYEEADHRHCHDTAVGTSGQCVRQIRFDGIFWLHTV